MNVYYNDYALKKYIFFFKLITDNCEIIFHKNKYINRRDYNNCMIFSIITICINYIIIHIYIFNHKRTPNPLNVPYYIFVALPNTQLNFSLAYNS
jgi:hypothetical protein